MTVSDVQPALDVQLVDISSLQPHARNYRVHSGDQLAQLTASITEHGFYRNVVIAEDGTILAGHGVVEAAQLLGLSQVPVIRLPISADSPQALKVMTSDNEISNGADVNDWALAGLLREIMDTSDTGLDGTGFTAEQLAALVFVARPPGEVDGKNTANEWVGLPAFEPPTNEIELVVRFDTEADRARFLDVIEVTHTRRLGKIWSARWPDRESNDLKSVGFQ